MTYRLLDLFCGAGGAGMGYHRAGFEVVGVDIAPQKHYPFEFHQADALEYLAEHGAEFDAIHASPPCHGYSVTKSLWKDKERKLMLPDTREALIKIGKPWIIENVMGAPVRWSVILCGVMFGLKTYRHRHFETSFLIFQPQHFSHPETIGRRGEGVSPSGYCNPCGHLKIKGQGEKWKQALQIEWMSIPELTQAIPPAYTEFIGRQLMDYLDSYSPTGQVSG